MVRFVWQMAELKLKAELKCALMTHGALSVMIDSLMLMLQLCANRLDTQLTLHQVQCALLYFLYILLYSSCTVAVYRSRAYFGSGSGRIFLDEIICNGSESRLVDCDMDHDVIGTHNCEHIEDVGVICTEISTLVYAKNNINAFNIV